MPFCKEVVMLEKFEVITNKRIIIDTNVLIYSGNISLSEAVRTLLRTLKNNNNDLSLSEISYYELLKSSPKDRLLRYYQKLIDYIDSQPLTKEVLNSASLLYQAYSEKRRASISDADILIGATASYKNAHILTCNRRDFPENKWAVVAHGYFIESLFEKCNLINVYLLSLRK